MEDIAQHFGLGASGHGHQHHHNQLPWGSSPLSAVVALPPPQQQQQSGGYLAHSPLSLNTAPSGGNHGGGNPVLQLANGSLLEACAKAAKEPSSSSSYGVDVDAIKAKIISHPHYSSLLAAYLDCQKASDSSTAGLLLVTLAVALLHKKFLFYISCKKWSMRFACLLIEATVHQVHVNMLFVSLG
jgi:homeobox protein Meis2